MKRLNIYSAFQSLGVPSTKEDIIIQVAKQQNIRFNELPGLQKDVDTALMESIRLGFVDRHGNVYKLNMEIPSTNAALKLKPLRQAGIESSPRPVIGQGDERPMGCTCITVDNNKSRQRRRRSSLCSLCGLHSEHLTGSDQDHDGDNNDKWPSPEACL